jgi:prepilin-type N-terminal cleavage/methylation domain-containing protein
MKSRQNQQGFSLVELLTVLAIMAVLVGISIPAVQGIRSTYNRKTAVDLVMTTVEKARVSAIQSGENSYVILALSLDSGVSQDAIMVVGDAPLGSTSSSQIFYTHWIKLPTNVRFRSAANTLVKNALPLSSTQKTTLPQLPGGPSNYSYQGFTFDSTGTLINPPPGSGVLGMALYEGIRTSRSAEIAQGPSAAATAGRSGATLSAATDVTGLYEVIRLSRYSGRSWADVSTLAN